MQEQSSATHGNAWNSREERRQTILAAAARAFTQRGYHETSMDGLAAAVGVSKPVLYYYVPNKDQLLFECAQRARGEMERVLAECQDESLNGIAALSRFFRAYARVIVSDFGRCLAMIDPKALKPDSRADDIRGRRAIEAAVVRLIVRGQTEGSIRKADARLVARALFGMFNGLPHWFTADGELDVDGIAAAYLDIVLNGVAGATA